MSAQTDSPQQLQQLYKQLKQQLADSDFESATNTLPQLLTALEQLPEHWTESEQWVETVAEINDFLNEIQPELEQARDETQETITKIGKSKKGVKAYTK
ncbi:hypothetical protein [Idiomarina seosinensis]|uniref:Flagellar protein FliT n=1 Tax=Idiomarina seosinensis TaxID=281739 RepID=A0A432ZID9_9GAMM|nr:hypothetical protein [Idiomarina seosinensis]RUO77042.1 hypothetical protein CWI81_00625 [Idiomarina seosinensis]